MKNMRKLASLLLALVMVFAMATTAFAADITKETGFTGDASITVTLPATNGASANNTYKIYKVFDATTDGKNIVYTLVDGKSAPPAGFVLESGYVEYAGESETDALTPADISAIASYVTSSDLVATVETTANDTSFTVDGLPYGYYYITTTTGTVVTVDSTHKNAEVEDKNVVPTVDKSITGASSVDAAGEKALAQIGTDVTYTGSVTVGYGVENYVYHDTMSTGLSFKEDTLVVKVNGVVVDAENYTLNTNPGNNETFTVSFKNNYIASLAKDTVISIEYKATITDDALTDDPENNTAYLSYGNTDDIDNTPTVTTKVWNAQIVITKTDSDDQPLAGAGFVLKNAEGKFYKLVDGVVTWVDAIADSDLVLTTEEDNTIEFTGLANGTYTLVEQVVPAGYNKAADKNFTVDGADVATFNTEANLEQEDTIVNQSGQVLPSTGGMGTTLFYIVGGILVVAAVVLLVTKKRMTVAE